jgi:hypothetical protein
MPGNRPHTSGDDDIVTNTGVALALKIRSGYSPVGFGCTSVGEREPRELIGSKANARERRSFRLVVTRCRHHPMRQSLQGALTCDGSLSVLP